MCYQRVSLWHHRIGRTSWLPLSGGRTAFGGTSSDLRESVRVRRADSSSETQEQEFTTVNDRVEALSSYGYKADVSGKLPTKSENTLAFWLTFVTHAAVDSTNSSPIERSLTTVTFRGRSVVFAPNGEPRSTRPLLRWWRPGEKRASNHL